MVGTSGRWCAAVDSLPCPRGEGVVCDGPDVDTRVSGKVGYTVGGCRLYIPELSSESHASDRVVIEDVEGAWGRGRPVAHLRAQSIEVCSWRSHATISHVEPERGL